MQGKYAQMECSLFFFVGMSCGRKECQPWDASFIVLHEPQEMDVKRTAESDRFALPDVPIGSKTVCLSVQQQKSDLTSHTLLLGLEQLLLLMT